MFTLGYLVMSVLLICVYPWVSSDVSVAYLCLPLGISGSQCCSSVPTLGYLVMSVLLIVLTVGYLLRSVLLICAYPWVSSVVRVAICVYPWVSSDVSVAHLCLPLGI